MAKELPKDLNKKAIEQLIEACIAFYPAAVLGQGHTGYQRSEFKVTELNQTWTNRSEFLKYILELTDETDIKRASNILEGWNEERKKQEPEKEEEKQPEKTVPTRAELEQLEEEQRQREEAKAKIDQNAKDQTAAQIKFLEEKAKLKGKVVYLEPEKKVTPALTSTEESARLELLNAARRSPKTFVEKFSKEVIAKLPDSVKASVPPAEIDVIAKQVAADFLTRLVAEDKFIALPAGAFSSLLKSNLVPLLIKKNSLPVLSALTAATDGVTRSFLQPVVGQGLVNFYYQDPQITYKVTDQPTSNTTLKVDLEKLHENFGNLTGNPIFQALQNKAQDKLIGYGQKQLATYIAKLPSDGLLGFAKRYLSTGSLTNAFSLLSTTGATYEATSTVGWVIQTALPEWAPLIESAASKFGVDVGLAAVNTMAPVAAAAVETTAVTAAGASAAAAAVETTAAVAGAAITEAGTVAVGVEAGAVAGAGLSAIFGPLAPFVAPVLIALGAFVGKIISKITEKVGPFLKKHFGQLVLVGAIGAGLVLGFPLLVAVGSVILVGSIVAGTAGIAATGIGFVGFLSGSFHGLLGATLGSWAKYLVIALLGITIYTALAMFIINSGAYIVPPSGNLAQNLGQSEFITVTKEASVSSLANAELPKTVNYTITVSAPKGSLSNINFKNECSVIKEGGSPSCAHPTPPETPTVIDANAPFTFSYSQTYDSSFSNSLVTDSFTVTADSPDGKAESSIASASVVIGAPPTKCFDVAGNWPANYKANVLSAIATLTSNYASYATKVCNGGNLRIVYDTTKNPGGWGYYSGGTIYLNGGGLSSQIDTLYILSHESGHHLGFSSGPRFYAEYLDTAGVTQELPLCSYINTRNPAEGFAESIALYVTKDQSSQWQRLCSGTYQTKYPKHWNFDKNVLFQ